jgi:hypothetical protein
MNTKNRDSVAANVLLLAVAFAFVFALLAPPTHVRHELPTAYDNARMYAETHGKLPDWCARAATDSEVEACEMVDAYLDDNSSEESNK